MKYPVNNLPIELISSVGFEEGFSSRIYIDTEGFQTIGYGFCLDKIGMPKPVAKYWLKLILRNTAKRLTTSEQMGEIFNGLNQHRQTALINIAYQLGLNGLGNFKKMWRALEQENWKKAKQEALDSVWASQTPHRAKRIAEVLLTGTMDVYSESMRQFSETD